MSAICYESSQLIIQIIQFHNTSNPNQSTTGYMSMVGWKRPEWGKKKGLECTHTTRIERIASQLVTMAKGCLYQHQWKLLIGHWVDPGCKHQIGGQ